jgi:hypothetical protein
VEKSIFSFLLFSFANYTFSSTNNHGVCRKIPRTRVVITRGESFFGIRQPRDRGRKPLLRGKIHKKQVRIKLAFRFVVAPKQVHSGGRSCSGVSCVLHIRSACVLRECVCVRSRVRVRARVCMCVCMFACWCLRVRI